MPGSGHSQIAIDVCRPFFKYLNQIKMAEVMRESFLPPAPSISRMRWLIGVGCVVIVAVIWTFSSVLVQYVFDDLDFNRPFFVTYVANSLFVVNLPLYYIGKHFGFVKNTEEQATVRQTFKISAIVAPLWFIANFTYTISLSMTSVTSSTIISSTSAMFTFGLSIYFLKEKFTWSKLGGVALCMLGNSCTVLNDSSGVGGDSVWGDLLALFAAFMYGVYTTTIRRHIPDENKVSLALFFGLLGAINFFCLLPVVLVLHWTHVESMSELTGQIIGLLTVKGLFDNVLSDYLWALSMIFTTPTVATIGLSLTVPLAISSDYLFHTVSPTLVTCLASAFVIAGFILINVTSSKTESLPLELLYDTFDVHA
ncbi:Drug/Metabolite Transporter (DMT) Superfamily [Thraustotheca clavata]|uniref:Drug/Metabolite Transporter (DMT) Superfamily n=1 Tax=Thraustotheca clavata TaxID=74557 RepID=A0A1W0ACL1_9STRA|nr:Drug/Metabolite Transporter (DMT) Superfamily [Thraustotheca clavata]